MDITLIKRALTSMADTMMITGYTFQEMDGITKINVIMMKLIMNFVMKKILMTDLIMNTKIFTKEIIRTLTTTTTIMTVMILMMTLFQMILMILTL